MSEVMILQTGLANMASVQAAFKRLGQELRWTTDPREVSQADRVVLPGVGAFGPAMGRLIELGLVEAIQARIEEGRPTLAICLGLQLLAEESEESPGAKGLGCYEGKVESFPDELIVPQLGWNRIEADPGCSFLESGFVYYANSYRLSKAPKGWLQAQSFYGSRFIGALERGDVLACQFHPELSGKLGSTILQRWLEKGGATC